MHFDFGFGRAPEGGPDSGNRRLLSTNIETDSEIARTVVVMRAALSEV